LVPQPGNAAGRPVECHQDNVTEHRRQDHGTRSGITAGTKTHDGDHLQTVSVCFFSPSFPQKWVS